MCPNLRPLLYCYSQFCVVIVYSFHEDSEGHDQRVPDSGIIVACGIHNIQVVYITVTSTFRCSIV